MKRDVHIVFGETAKKLLIESGIFNPDTSELIVLYDLLSIGPLYDSDTEAEIRHRENYLSSLFGELCIENVGSIVKNDIRALGKLNSLHELSAIYIWLGQRDNQIFSKARLLYQLTETKGSVFIADFPNIPVRSSRGEIIYSEILSHMPLDGLEIEKHFKKLDREDFRFWADVWRRVINEKNALLRLYSREGQIIFDDGAYFDSFLLDRCQNYFQKAALVIGYSLGTLFFETNSDIGDIYLNHRLKNLVLEGKILHRGELKEIRDYEVRLAV